MGEHHLRSQPVGTSIGRLLVLLTALAGLFAMHGMSDHGAVSHDLMHSVVASHQADASAGMSLLMTEPDAASVGSPSSSSDHSALGLCSAVLGLGLLLGLARGLWRSLSSLLSVERVDHWLIARPRSPDPPDLIRFAIQRC